MKVVIFDLDGTLADGSGRLHLLPTKDLHLTDSWTEFNKACVWDRPIWDTIDVCNSLEESGMWVIVLTGRSDIVRVETEAWLKENNVNYNELIMRPHDDNRKDTVIKEEVINQIRSEGHQIVAAWDDSPNVVSHFRSLGITTYQVCDYGDTMQRTDLHSHGVEMLK